MLLSGSTNTFLIVCVRNLKPGDTDSEQSSKVANPAFEFRSSDSKSHAPLSHPIASISKSCLQKFSIRQGNYLPCSLHVLSINKLK